jgi:aminoglycoside phosphotransferase (APT) family kinase protein
LLHLDYHPLNVLVKHGAISAILDWTNARAGDPRCDLARTESILTFAPLPHPGTQATDTKEALISGWRRGYTASAGPVHGMGSFRAWAAAFMLHDLRPRLGRPDLPWLTEELLERVKDWGMMQSGQPEADWF